MKAQATLTTAHDPRRSDVMAKRTAGYRMGIDLGGTKILAAVVGADGAILGMAKKKDQGRSGARRGDQAHRRHGGCGRVRG
jgi:hypothetical protein